MLQLFALKENTLSNTLFKIISVIRPSTLLRVLFIGDQNLLRRERLGRALNLPTKKLSPPSFLHASHHPSYDCRPHIYWKKVSLIAFRQIWTKILPVLHIFSFIITTNNLKTLIGIKTFKTKAVSSRIISLNCISYISHLTKNVPPPFILLVAPTMYELPYSLGFFSHLQGFPQTVGLGETL